MFDDLLAGNSTYDGPRPHPGKGLAVLSCMDGRVDPAALLGLRPGEALILRNAGARVTDDVLRSLAVATSFLNVRRVAVIQHTDCAMTRLSEDEIRERLSSRVRDGFRSHNFMTMSDQAAALRADVAAVRECALLPDGVEVAAFMFDVVTGTLTLEPG